MVAAKRGATGRVWMLAASALVLLVAAGYAWLHRSSDAPSAPGPTRLIWQRPAERTGEYIGSAACAACHASIYETFQRHPMGRSLASISEAEVVEDYTQNTSVTVQPRAYRVERTEESVWHHESRTDAAGELLYDQRVPIHYALGSGQRGRSYLIDRDGWLFVSPIAWYSDAQRWDLAPGYDAQRHPRFEREATDRCLVCHAGRMNRTAHSSGDMMRYGQPPLLEPAIGCERCHGPGGEHARYRRAGGSLASADHIVNPARLDRARRESVCNQCHLQGEHQVLRYGRSHGDFRPGDLLGEVWSVFIRRADLPSSDTNLAVSQVEQLHASACYRESRGEMGCTTCHDPHDRPSAANAAVYFDRRCLKCHQEQDCSLPLAERHRDAAAGSCTTCHMPALPAQDVPHTAQTDHRILRRSPLRAVAMSVTGSEPDELQIFDRESHALTPMETKRAFALMLAGRAEWDRSPQSAQRAELLLEQLQPLAADDMPAWDALALVKALQGQKDEAIGLWEQLLVQDPRHLDSLYSLAVTFYERGELRRALPYLERYLAENPWNAEVYGRYSFALAQAGRLPEAVEAAQRSQALDPSVARTHLWLAELLQVQGDQVRAEEHARRAAQLSSAGD